MENPKGLAGPKESVGTVSVLSRSLCQSISEVAGDSKHIVTTGLLREGLMGLGNKPQHEGAGFPYSPAAL